MKKYPLSICIPLIAVAVYLALALPGMNQPVTDDEIYEIENAELLLEGRPIQLFLPPFYNAILALSIRIFGRDPWAFRLPGILSAIAALTALVAILRMLFKESHDPRILLASLFLASCPAFVQGSLLIHIDNTILTPLIAWWIFFTLRYTRNRSHRDSRAAGFFFALALLAKFSTPLLILPAVLLWFLLRHRTRLLRYTTAMLGGGAGFLASWLLFTFFLNLSFLQPFIHAGQRAHLYALSLTNSVHALPMNLVFLTIWLTPWTLLLAALHLPVALKTMRQTKEEGLLLWFSAWAIFSYLFLSTINHGFPKYFIPALPLLMAAICVQESEDVCHSPAVFAHMGLTAFAVAWLYILCSPDPVLLVRFTLREAAVSGSAPSALIKSATGIATIWILPLVAWGLQRIVRRRYKPAVPSLSLRSFALATALGFGFGMSFRMATAPYQTNYSYGERATMDMHAYIAGRLSPDDRILATKDVLYRLNRRDQYHGREIWRDPDRLASTLLNPSLHFLVASPPSLSVGTMRLLQTEGSIHDILDKHYTLNRIGTWRMYEKKSR